MSVDSPTVHPLHGVGISLPKGGGGQSAKPREKRPMRRGGCDRHGIETEWADENKRQVNE